MKLRAICKKHPTAAVLILAATTQFVKNNVPEYCAEEDEKAIGIELDDANLYCTAFIGMDPKYCRMGEHDLTFQVVESWQ